jgi:hypothetical protein
VLSSSIDAMQVHTLAYLLFEELAQNMPLATPLRTESQSV